LRAYGEVKGWVYADRGGEMRPFLPKEAERLAPFASVVGAILERSAILSDQRRLREQIRLMEKHLSPEVSRMLAAQPMSLEESMLSVEEREVSVLFSDIQGFTSLSERLAAPEIAALLNEYFQRMVDVVNVNQGMVNKFIGDAIMALFGAPKSRGNDAVNAVMAGLQMTEALKLFSAQIDERKRFNIRIGINTGKVVAGNIGSEKKMEYTVLGDEVNLAQRLESISPPNVVTIGPRTAELVRDRFRLEKVSGVKVKGKSNLLEVYRVLGLADQSR
jgi:adenylate cyclase